MKIIYFANARIPTEKAHGYQIMKMCSSFAAAGADIQLIVPGRKNRLTENPFVYYGMIDNFSITFLPTINILGFGRFGFYAQTMWFMVLCTIYGLRHQADAYYSRDESALVILKFFRRTILEVHNVPTKFIFWYTWILRGVSKFISTNQWKAEFLDKSCGIKQQRILVFPNAIDIPEILPQRSTINMPELIAGNKNIVYTGHLYTWKGAHILAAAADFLPKNVSVIFVGGLEEDILKLNKISHRIICVGHKNHEEVLSYLSVADVVIIPNIPETQESIYATSPMKLFEYMAAQKPIVASDLPSIREIVDETCAVLVAPGDPAALAAGIKYVLDNPVQAEKLVVRAFERVKKFTWKKRAHTILDFILL